MTTVEPIFQADEEQQFGMFSKRDLVRIVFAHKWIIMICFITVSVLVTAGLFYLPATYEAQAKILIKTEEQGSPRHLEDITTLDRRRDADPVQRRIETEMELIETWPLAAQVVDDLDIKFNQVYLKPHVHFLIPVMNGFDWAMERFLGVKPDPEKFGKRDTTEGFLGSITVQPLKSKSAETNSNIIAVTLKSPDPRIAKEGLATLLSIYAKMDNKLNDENASKAYAIVEADRAIALSRVETAEHKLRQFLAEKGWTRRMPILDDSITAQEAKTGKVASPTDVAMTDGEVPPEKIGGLSQLEPTASNFTEEDGESKSTSNQSPANPPTDASMEDAVTSPRDQKSIALLKAHLIEKEMTLSQARQKYRGVENPEILALSREIDELKARIENEIRKDAQNEMQLVALERNLKAAETRYLDLNRQLDRIALYRRMNDQYSGHRVIIEEPLLPDTSDTKRKIVLAVAGSFVGLIIGLGLAGFLEYVDPRLRSKGDVKKHLGLEVLATIPKTRRRVLAQVIDPAKA